MGLGAIARAAGVSTAAVSYALRNKQGVGEKTREKILKIARKMGYSPDPRMAEVLTVARRAKNRELLPIAWLNNHIVEDAWHRFDYLKPYLEGARERAGELGYHLEEMWTREPGMTKARLAKILYHRGIEGVIVTQYINHIRLDWRRLAAVAMHGQMIAPHLPRVMPDLACNLYTAVKQLRRLGYRRIGICLESPLENYAYVTLRPVAKHLNSIAPAIDRVPPLFYQWGLSKNRDEGRQATAWIERYRPDAIVCHSSMLLIWVQKLGLEVPRDIALVHLATDDDVADWAGIRSHRRVIGAVAVDQVVSRMLNGQFGVPAVAQDTLIQGAWHGGWTVGRRSRPRPT